AHMGGQMVVFLAGLQAIPPAYLDAARVDGAGAWRGFWRVTLPLLRPVTWFVVLTGVLGALQTFTLVFVLTQGGPSPSHSNGVMGEGELLRWPPPLLPHAPTTGNYSAMVEVLPYARVLLNTAILAGCVMVGQVLTSAAAGYAFARLRFPGRDGIIAASLAILTIPAILL